MTPWHDHDVDPLALADSAVDRCPRCGAWRYRGHCTTETAAGKAVNTLPGQAPLHIVPVASADPKRRRVRVTVRGKHDIDWLVVATQFNAPARESS